MGYNLSKFVHEKLQQKLKEQEQLLKEFNINSATHANRILLYEGLLISANPEQFVRILKKKGLNAEISDQNRIDSIHVLIHKDEGFNSSTLKQLCTVCGWQIAVESDNQIVCSRKFGDDADDIVYNQNNGLLAHIAPTQSFSKIRTKGLTPRHQNKNENHGDRVYCLTNMGAVYELAYSFIPHYMWTQDQIDNNTFKFVMLILDLSKLDKEKSVIPKFFIDPKARYSVYTHNNVPPQCIVNAIEITMQLFQSYSERFNKDNVKITEKRIRL